MPALPDWLKAANPAEYAAEGMRIGDARAARADQAAERGAAGDRAQQEIQLRQQELEAQATQAAQKYQAQRAYQQFIAGGGDPVQGILKYGPAMGASGSMGSALRQRQAQQPKAPPQIQMQPGPNGTQIPVLVQNGHASVVPRAAYQPPQVRQPNPAQVPEGSKFVAADQASGTPAHWERPKSGAAAKPGSLTQQQQARLRIQAGNLKALQKQMADTGFALLPPADQAKVKQQAEAAGAEIDQLTKGQAAGDGTAAAKPNAVKRFKFNAESGKLEPAQTGTAAASPAHTEDADAALVEQ